MSVYFSTAILLLMLTLICAVEGATLAHTTYTGVGSTIGVTQTTDQAVPTADATLPHTTYTGVGSTIGVTQTTDQAVPTADDDIPVGMVIGFPVVGLAAVFGIVAAFYSYRRYRRGRLWCFQPQNQRNVHPHMDAGNFYMRNAGDIADGGNDDTACTGFVQIDLNSDSEEDKFNNPRKPSRKIREERSKSDKQTVEFDKTTRAFSVKTTIPTRTGGIGSLNGEHSHNTLPRANDESPTNNPTGTVTEATVEVINVVNDDNDDEYEVAEIVHNTETDDNLEDDYEPMELSINQKGEDTRIKSGDGSSDKFAIPSERRFISRSMINKTAISGGTEDSPKRSQSTRKPPRATPRESQIRDTIDPYDYPPGIPILRSDRNNNSESAGVYVGVVKDNEPTGKLPNVAATPMNTSDDRVVTRERTTNIAVSKDSVYDYPRPQSEGAKPTNQSMLMNERQDNEDIYDYPRSNSVSLIRQQSSVEIRSDDGIQPVTAERDPIAGKRNIQNNEPMSDEYGIFTMDLEETEDSIYQVPKPLSIHGDEEQNVDADEIYVNLPIHS